MPTAAHFTPALFQFLRDLKTHNDRDWFQANKARFDDDVRDPLLRFITDFAPHLKKLSPHFRADPKANGGSMFRIYRDVRFALDKSPYKTHAAAQFRHVRAKSAYTPGFYLHLEPDSVFMGAGIWHPDSRGQRAIRDAMVADPKAWTAATRSKRFSSVCTLAGESLKRPPTGYPKDHPLAADLMRKDFIATVNFKEQDATSADFLKHFVGACSASAPLVAFIAEALQLEF